MADLLREYLIKFGFVTSGEDRIRNTLRATATELDKIAAKDLALAQQRMKLVALTGKVFGAQQDDYRKIAAAVDKLSAAEVKANTQRLKIFAEMQRFSGANVRAQREGERAFEAHGRAAERFGGIIGRSAVAPINALIRSLTLFAGTYFSIRGITNTIQDLAKLDDQSRKIGASVNNIRSIEHAWTAVGGAAGEAASAMASMKEAAIQPGNAKLLEHFGVTAKDAAERFVQLAEAYSRMQPFVAVNFGQTFGHSASQVATMAKESANLRIEFEKNAKFLASFGINADTAARNSKELAVQASKFAMGLTRVRDALFMGSAAGGRGFMEKINDWLEGGGGKRFAAIAKEIGDRLGTWIGKKGGVGDQFVDWLEKVSKTDSPESESWKRFFTDLEEGATGAGRALLFTAQGMGRLLDLARDLDQFFSSKGGVGAFGRAARGAIGLPKTSLDIEAEGPLTGDDPEALRRQEQARMEQLRQARVREAGKSIWRRLWETFTTDIKRYDDFGDPGTAPPPDTASPEARDYIRRRRGFGGSESSDALGGGIGSDQLGKIEDNTEETVKELKRAGSVWEKIGNMLPSWAQQAALRDGGGGGGGGAGGGGGGGGASPGIGAPGTETPGTGAPGTGTPGARISPNAPAGPGSSVPGGGGGGRGRGAPGTGAPADPGFRAPASGAEGPPGTYRKQYAVGEADLDQKVIDTIAGEARRGNQAGVDAVINNMLNRVGSGQWGPDKNLLQVARAKGQYAGYRRAGAQESEWIRSRIRLAAEGRIPDPTRGSTMFRAAYYRGPWMQRYGRSGVNVGGNVFNYKPGTGGPYRAYDQPVVASGGADYGSREGLRPGPGMGLPGATAEAPTFENVAARRAPPKKGLSPSQQKQQDELMWGLKRAVDVGEMSDEGREGMRPGPGGGLLDVPDPMNPTMTKRQRRAEAERYFKQNPWGPGFGEGETQRGGGANIGELNEYLKSLKKSPEAEQLIDQGFGVGRKHHDQLVSLRTKNLFASRGGSGASYALGDVSNDNSRKMDQQNTFNTTIHTTGDTREAGRLLTRANEQTALLLQNRGAIV